MRKHRVFLVGLIILLISIPLISLSWCQQYSGMSSTFKKENLSYRSPYDNDGNSFGYELKNVYLKVTYNQVGKATFENLGSSTTGMYYSGNHKKPITGSVDHLIGDGRGNLLLHVPAGSKYGFRKEEVRNILSKKSLQIPFNVVDRSGGIIATLDFSDNIATAGPKGMYIGFDPMVEFGNLNLGQGLAYEMGVGPQKKPSNRWGDKGEITNNQILAKGFDLIARDNFSEAENIFNEVLKADPDNPLALNNLAAIMVSNKMLDKADSLLNQALHRAKGYMVEVNKVVSVQDICLVFKPASEGNPQKELLPFIKLNIEMIKKLHDREIAQGKPQSISTKQPIQPVAATKPGYPETKPAPPPQDPNIQLNRGKMGQEAAEKPSLNIINVEITKKPQVAQKGAKLDLLSGGITPVNSKIIPHKGNVFVILDYTIILPQDNMKLEFARDLYLMDAEANKVNGAPYSSDSFFLGGTGQNFSKKGAHNEKMLFEVKDRNVNGSKVVLFGKNYPLNP